MIPKFRSWDKQECEFVPYLHNIVLKLDGTIEGIEYEMPHEGIVYNDISYFELLQSTGLKDKNGVEIYEGDVLEIPVAIDTETLNGEVVFEDGVFGIKDVLYGWGFEIGLVPLIEIISAKKVIIIGNIYEHPHLLEE